MKTEHDGPNKILLYTIIALLIVAIGFGIAYAFFSPDTTHGNGTVSIDVTTSPEVTISYENGQNLTLTANEPGASATALFDIFMDSDGSNISAVYNINWNITENTFEYDPEASTPKPAEITYSFYYSMDTGDNKNWTAITTNTDLTCDSNCTFPMSIPLATNELLTTGNNSTIRKYYKLEVTYPSMNKDQSYNMNKTISGTIKFENAN